MAPLILKKNKKNYLLNLYFPLTSWKPSLQMTNVWLRLAREAAGSQTFTSPEGTPTPKKEDTDF